MILLALKLFIMTCTFIWCVSQVIYGTVCLMADDRGGCLRHWAAGGLLFSATLWAFIHY